MSIKLVQNIPDSASGLYCTVGRSKSQLYFFVMGSFIGRCESHTRYFRDGKLIIGAAKLVDLDNYIKLFRGYFTKYTHASTLFLFNTNILV